jgi:serine protease Do
MVGPNMRGISLTCAIVLAIVLAGCNTTSPMRFPQVRAIPHSQPMDVHREQPTVALSKIVANLRRGTAIAHFPAFGSNLGGTLCNHRHLGESRLEWGSGSRYLGDWNSELGEVFHDVLSSNGANVVGDPKDLFEKEKGGTNAEYLIGASILDVKGNFCESYHWFHGISLDEYSGEFYAKIEWTVFSSLAKSEVLKVQTEGYHLDKKPKRQGIAAVFVEAFAQAAEAFAANDEFRKIVLQGPPERVEPSETFALLELNGATPSKLPIEKSMSRVLNGVATVRIGAGHGSGFVITKDGLLLTNAHVVGNAKRVAIRFTSGIEVDGTVLRKSVARDIALVQVPIRTQYPLPVRFDGVSRFDTVFAVGSPQSETLDATVTKGIVSAKRIQDKSGLTFIQSDVAISGGNSGGPLLDHHGNVVGVSTLKIMRVGVEGLGFFIPIADALAALNVEMR